MPSPDFQVGVIAYSFGYPSTTDVNKDIFESARRAVMLYGAQLYTDIDLPSEMDVTRIPWNNSAPPSTLRISRGAVQWAKEKGIHHLVYACALPHRQRVWRDLRLAIGEAGFKEMKIRGPSAHRLRRYDRWFSPQSEQWSTRFEILWDIREGILRLMPVALYKRIAVR
jgi:hypothetical protein